MHMNQVAIAYSSEEEKALIKASLGLTTADWVKDTVKSHVTVLGRHGEYVTGENVAELEFCMAMGGTQFELIRYKSGPNWISEAARLGVRFPMVAHVGFHLDDGEDWPPVEIGGLLAQEAITVEHSNAEVNAADRRYHYRIYRIGPSTYLKFIKRKTLVEAPEQKAWEYEPRGDNLSAAEQAKANQEAALKAALDQAMPGPALTGKLDQRQGNEEGVQSGGFMQNQGDEQAVLDAEADGGTAGTDTTATSE